MPQVQPQEVQPHLASGTESLDVGDPWGTSPKRLPSVVKACKAFPQEGIPVKTIGWARIQSVKPLTRASFLWMGVLLALRIPAAPAFAQLELDAQLGRSQIVSPTKDCPACDLTGAELQGVDLQGANLKEVILKQANLQAADLSQSILNLADLSQANLSGSDQSGAFLWEADLTHTNLQEANLTGANLQVADLSEADLRGAILNQADLTGAKLHNVDLRGADLRGAFLEGADLTGALYDAQTQLDPALNPSAWGMVFIP